MSTDPDPRERLAAYDEVIARDSGSADLEAKRRVVDALAKKGSLLEKLGERESALATFNLVISRAGTEQDPRIRFAAARAFWWRAKYAQESGQLEDALTALDAALERLPDSPSPKAEHMRYVTLFLRTNLLFELARWEEAIHAADDVVQAVDATTSPVDAEFAAGALWEKGGALHQLGRRDEEREVLRYIINRFGDDARGSVARAIYNEGVYLRDEGDVDGAIAQWDELFARYRTNLPPSIAFTPIKGQLAKAHELAGRGQLEQALAICRSMTRLCENSDLPDREERLAEIQRSAHTCGIAAQQTGRPTTRFRNAAKRALRARR